MPEEQQPTEQDQEFLAWVTKTGRFFDKEITIQMEKGDESANTLILATIRDMNLMLLNRVLELKENCLT